MIVFKFNGYKFPTVNHGKTVNKSGRFILKNSTRDFKNQILLDAKTQYKSNLFSSFDPSIHYIESEYMYYTPKLLTKKGTISMNKPDWDGNIKYVQDACCKVMGINDSFILESTVKQFYSDKETFICIYRLCNQMSRL